MTPETDLVVRREHLLLALNLAQPTSLGWQLRGLIPPNDGKGPSQLKLWRLSSIRAWNPAVADDIELLLSIPAFSPRPVRGRVSGLKKAA